VAAVELALVLPLLLLLLFGIVEFSRAFYTQLRLQDAAREGARAIALQYDDPGPIDLLDVTTQTLSDILGLDVGVVGGLIHEITFCSTDAAAPPDQRATLVLRQNLPLALPFPEDVNWDTVTVTGSAQMPCEG